MYADYALFFANDDKLVRSRLFVLFVNLGEVK
jgi:hypothetical protein